MNIDRSILDQLSKEQILVAAKFLEDVFLRQKKNIDLTDQQTKDTVVIILKASKIGPLTRDLFSSLAQSVQFDLLTYFKDEEKFELVCLLPNINDIKYNFDQFSDDEKKVFLEYLYSNNTLLYKEFTDFINPSIDIVQGVVIDKPKVSVSDILKDVSLLTDLLINDDQSVEDCQSYAQILINKYQLHDLTIFVREFVVMIKDLNLTLVSKTHFFTYLKFYNVIQLYISIDHEYLDYVYPVIDQFLVAMSAVTTLDWRIKLFEQLPEFIIRICLERLAEFETISDQKKRNFYCKLFNDLKNNLNHDGVHHLKYVFDQL